MSESPVNSSNLQIISQSTTQLRLQLGVADTKKALSAHWKEFTSISSASPWLLFFLLLFFLRVIRFNYVYFIFLICGLFMVAVIQILIIHYFQSWMFDKTSGNLTYKGKNFLGITTNSHNLNTISAVAVEEMNESGQASSRLVLLRRQKSKPLVIDSSINGWSDQDKAFALNRQQEISASISAFMGW